MRPFSAMIWKIFNLRLYPILGVALVGLIPTVWASSASPWPRNEIERPPSSPSVSAEKVRISLQLIPYQKVEPSSVADRETYQIQSQSILRYTLRAQLTKSNHFYFNGFHIETTPLAWDQASNLYTLKIAISKQFGKKGEVEEELGDLILQGKLLGQDGLYVLHGSTSKKFKNKFGQPILDLLAGYSPPSELQTARGPADSEISKR